VVLAAERTVRLLMRLLVEPLEDTVEQPVGRLLVLLHPLLVVTADQL